MARVEQWLVRDLRDDARAAPHAIRLKLEKLARDPFSFFRGTLPEYVRHLRGALRGPLAAPRGLVTGDLHLENFGTYLGEHGQVAFDLNDFDEVTRAPLCIDLRRLAASAALVSGSSKGAAAVLDGFRTGFELPLDAELELPASVRALIRVSARAKHSAFLADTTLLDGRSLRLKLGPTLHAPHAALAPALERALRTMPARRAPRVFALLDAARRLAGNGSLGRRRYLALVRGFAPEPTLIDLKEPRPSPWGDAARLLGERHRARQVERAARALRACSERILGTVRLHGRLFQVREHSPHGMKLAANALSPAELLDYARFTGALLARSWLRSGQPVEELLRVIDGGGAAVLLASAEADASRIREQYARFMSQRERIANELALSA